jgi:membrane glycosyltransferase
VLPVAVGDKQAAGPALRRIFLIRRTERGKYKAGNIANFLEQHGGAYDFMLVLDADSVMLGESIKRLILRMQTQANLAILQTIVLPIRAETPLARLMAFGNSRTLPLLALGQYWFYGCDSVYWGHNALIRIAPFMEHCNLPIMPGKPPLGGHIMSQDIVEAALVARAGWAVEWDMEPRGSFDETPANILTYGRRDRRWCQGNLQHFWLIFGDGMKLAHRLYFGYPENRSKSLCTKTRNFHAKWWPDGLGDSWQISGR